MLKLAWVNGVLSCEVRKDMLIFQRNCYFPKMNYVFCLITNTHNFVRINVTITNNGVFNITYLFDVANEVKILVWHTYWHP